MISRAGQEVFRERDYIPMHPEVPAKNPELKPETGGYKAVVYSPEEVDANAQALGADLSGDIPLTAQYATLGASNRDSGT